MLRYFSIACLTMLKLSHRATSLKSIKIGCYFSSKPFCKVKESINSSIYAGPEEVGGVPWGAV